jgi:hypothetical protein
VTVTFLSTAARLAAFLGAGAMTTWAIKDSNGQVLPDFLGSSRIEVGCKVMPARYDVFRLHVSSSYRALFDRALQQVLERHGWQIVQIRYPTALHGAPNAAVAQGEEAAWPGYAGTPVWQRTSDNARSY